jgi:putative phage-type endonuclease
MNKQSTNFAVNDLERRKQGIGGSDAGTAIGVNPWKTPFQLYLEKIGEVIPEDISNKPAVKRGVRLEPEIMKWVAEDLDITIRKDNATHVSKKYPFLFCHNDGTIVGKKRLAEIKAPSLHMRDFWGEEGTDAIPQYYLAQGVHALAIQPEMEGVDYFAYFDPNILHFRLERKQSLIDAYIAKVKRFWGYVEHKIPPPPQDENDLIYKYFKKSGKYKASNPKIEDHVSKLIKIKAEKKVLDDEEREVKFHIKDFIGYDDGVQLNDGKKVTLSRVELQSFKESDLEKKAPDLHAKYCTIFDTKNFKKQHPEEYQDNCFTKQSNRLILPRY